MFNIFPLTISNGTVQYDHPIFGTKIYVLSGIRAMEESGQVMAKKCIIHDKLSKSISILFPIGQIKDEPGPATLRDTP